MHTRTILLVLHPHLHAGLTTVRLVEKVDAPAMIPAGEGSDDLPAVSKGFYDILDPESEDFYQPLDPDGGGSGGGGGASGGDTNPFATNSLPEIIYIK
jgi:hypothetical protein